ncbi:hypothetical protein FACS1894186_7300 [Alphaproteobacteria bacterium]|nr:hypothetical protein FACS1894186_7300 [Alphaproteobacteria bacterium]
MLYAPAAARALVPLDAPAAIARLSEELHQDSYGRIAQASRDIKALAAEVEASRRAAREAAARLQKQLALIDGPADAESPAKIEAPAVPPTSLVGMLQTISGGAKAPAAPPANDKAAAAPAADIPAAIAREKAKIVGELEELKYRIISYDLLLASLDELERECDAVVKRRFWTRIVARDTALLESGGLEAAGTGLLSVMRLSKRISVSWFHNEILGRGLPISGLLPLVALSVAFIAAGVWIKRRLLGRLGYSHIAVDPTYSRMLFAAFYEAMATGIIPAMTLASFSFWLARYDILTGDFYAIAEAGLWLCVALILVISFARAVLVPDLPSWRLIRLDTKAAFRLYHTIVYLAFMSASYLFMMRLFAHLRPMQEETFFLHDRLFILIYAVMGGGGALALVRGSIWNQADDEPARALSAGRLFWLAVRALTGASAVLAVALAAGGYLRLGEFIITHILLFGLLLAAYLLIRGFVSEVARVMLFSDFMRRLFDLKNSTLQKIRIASVFVIDCLLITGGAFVALPSFGFRTDEIRRALLGATSTIHFGGISISPKNILLAIAAFVIVLTVSKMLQARIVAGSAEASTDTDENVASSLATTVSYIGVIMAIGAAIAVLGVNFTNIAIIAGALSVGIGFGLQNIVNNLVSGIIILVEQPFQVGDWVIIDGQEGIVKKIKIRATEIETWQRAAVIIPNANILSGVLSNKTHGNSFGRVELGISIPHWENPEKARDLLLEIAGNMPNLLALPEPYVYFSGIENGCYSLELRGYVADILTGLTVKNELRFAIVRRFRHEKIPFSMPQVMVHQSKKQ